MFELIETVLAFTAIMLSLSILVKSLTSVVKNHFNYFADNLKREVEHFVRANSTEHFDKLEDLSIFKGIPWKQLDEKFFSLENAKIWLQELAGHTQIAALEARVAAHQASLKYEFEKQMKNLSLACGLALCLFANINALSIWDALYTDGQVRAKFASPEYVDNVLEQYKESESATKYAQAQGNDAQAQGNDAPAQGNDAQAQEDAALEKDRKKWQKQYETLTNDLDFGVGNIWKSDAQDKKPDFWLREFFGSLLTGIVVSIGAPYWHDLFRAMSQVRNSK